MEEEKRTKETIREEEDEKLKSMSDHQLLGDMHDFNTRKDSNFPTNTHEKEVEDMNDNSRISSSDSIHTEVNVEMNFLEKIPPDFDMARNHANAQMVKNLDENSVDKSKMKDNDYYCQ